MPTYEYLCQTCSHRFETWQKMTDDPLTTCPQCGNGIRRVLYPAGIVFKGSGFYKTDNGKAAIPPGNTNNDKKAETGDTGDKTANSQTANDSKSTEKATSSSAPATAVAD